MSDCEADYRSEHRYEKGKGYPVTPHTDTEEKWRDSHIQLQHRL